MKNNELSMLELTLKVPDEIQIVPSIGSVMHGALMELLPIKAVEWLHEYTRRPYSQYILRDIKRNQIKWRIASLESAARERVLDYVFAGPDSLYLKQKGFPVQIVDRQWIKQTSYDELLDTYLGEPQKFKGLDFEFLSPTSFKSDGQYCFFPQLNLIYQNILRRWNTFTMADKLDSELIFPALMKHSYISKYRLASQLFYLEKTKIPAFKGTITISASSNIMIYKLLALLGAYAEFSGIGIKTALGMGGAKHRIVK